ncbi:MAG: DUF1559 domain-containing protein [Armatimonadota bacterium]
MARTHPCYSRGFTFWEIIALVFVAVVFLTIILPFFLGFFHTHPKARQSSCASNMKQIGLALLGYAQDYDGKLPPGISQTRLADGKLHEQQWGSSTTAIVNGKSITIPGVIDSFIKNKQIFQCPSTDRPNRGLSYMYNDLAANATISDIPHPAVSVLSAESENQLPNIGHAKSLKAGGDEAVFGPPQKGKTRKLIQGVAVGNASLRHEVRTKNGSGGNYLFVDGHVRWMKPEDVFFPSRSSTSSSHRDAKTGKLLGPGPRGTSGSVLMYQGKAYKATFHVR